MISKRDLLGSINDLYSKFRYLDRSDTNRIGQIIDLRTRIKKLESSIINVNDDQFQKQIQCAAKGHNFVFEKDKRVYSLIEWVNCKKGQQFQFKCTNCNLTITKTLDELTATEKKALKDLGILEENNENTKRN